MVLILRSMLRGVRNVYVFTLIGRWCRLGFEELVLVVWGVGCCVCSGYVCVGYIVCVARYWRVG